MDPQSEVVSELIAFSEENANIELSPGPASLSTIHYPLALRSAGYETEHAGQSKLIKSEEEANRLSEEVYKRFNDKTAAAGGEHVSREPFSRCAPGMRSYFSP